MKIPSEPWFLVFNMFNTRGFRDYDDLIYSKYDLIMIYDDPSVPICT